MKQPVRKRSLASPSTAGTHLLRWYDTHARKLPWRAERGETPDPYRVWLSEIMLQQTTVAAVAPYYARFLERWPSVAALAAAPLDDILGAWAGLGYYARARNLHRAARVVAFELGGRFPENIEGLRKLPGVGAYTAGAVAAIGFGAPEVAVDANAERVLARYFAVEEPLPQAKPRLQELASALLPKSRAGDFAQGLMDLGALVCTPRTPLCGDCPWATTCRGRAKGIAGGLPRKAAKASRPVKRGAAFVARDRNGAVLLERRPENGLLGGMLQPPLGPWGARFPIASEALRQAPFRAAWARSGAVVRHVFTHFELELHVYCADVAVRPETPGMWLTAEELRSAALPTVMRKVLDSAS
jgi:A/G-specific adenine glycosylase